jgi:diguanylate cyclase
LKAGIRHELVERLQTIVGGVDVATETVRDLATRLRPPALDHLGLTAAIELEAAAISKRTGLRCRVIGNRKTDSLDRVQATALFRITQEALTNAARHATASAVTIAINQSRAVTSLRIRDNGIGMTEQQINGGGIGLLGMRERAELIGARFTITSKPGRGTSVRVVAPTARPEEQSNT